MSVVSIKEPDAYSPEAEQQVLGCLLLNPDRMGVALQPGPDLFADPVHAAIFEVMTEKFRAGELVSPPTVADRMRSHDGLAQLGGVSYIAKLSGGSGPNSSLPHYIELLVDMRSKRRIGSAIADASAAIARNDEPAHIISGRLEAALIIGAEATSGNKPVSMAAAVKTALDDAYAAYHGEGTRSVKSGFDALDRILGGFYPGDLILLGGRPSMGKTAASLSVALNVARSGGGVCIASLEMNPEAMAVRALSEASAQNGAGIEYAAIRRGAMTEAQARSLASTAQGVGDLPIMFLSRQYADIGALLAGAKQAQRIMGGNMRLMIVDYAQLLRSQARGRYEQITEISIALKALAGQLNVPVLALSQLSRAVEQREDKRPVLADLRESGQLEQDADTVLFCYRDEYYLQRGKPDDEDMELTAAWAQAMERQHNRLELIVAKQRQGDIGTAHLRFNPALNIVWEDERPWRAPA